MPFTASIVERNFAYVPDKILKLGGATWLRPLGGPALSAPWERIRIGVLCAATPNGTSNIIDALFLMGLCAGQTNPGSAFVTYSFIGASMIGAATTAATRTLTYTAGAGNPYFASTVGLGLRKTQAFPSLVTATFSGGLLLPIAGFSSGAGVAFYARRAIIILDITKTPGGSGGITLAVYYSTTAATIQGIDMRPDHLFEALDQPGTPSVRGGTFTQVLNSAVLTYSPLEGDVDTFELHWSNSTFPLEISAIGASILRPLSYTGINALGIADETFEEYSISTGSLAVANVLTGGSGWSAAGSINYDTSYNAGTLGNSSNLAAQVFTQYVGTTFSPDETFEQYNTGTVNSGTTINLGSYWTGAGVIEASISGNFTPQVFTQYVGTTFTPDEPFEQYNTGTVNSGTTINLGSYWTANAYLEARVANTVAQVFVELAGTTVGTPYDTFSTYVVNNGSDNGTTSSFAFGSFWAADGTIYNGSASQVNAINANPFPYTPAGYAGTIPYFNLVGTLVGFPFDMFESYVVNNGSDNGTTSSFAFGSYWSADGTIYSGSVSYIGSVDGNPFPYTPAGYAGTLPYFNLVGTLVGFPYDTFATYVVNNGSDNGTTSSFAFGSYWAATGTIFSVAAFSYVGTTSPNPFPLSGTQALAGTTVGFPFDTFQFYGTGTIISGVTLNAGSYWSGNGSIY